MPSYQTSEYLFPAKPNVRFKGNFSKPYAWDLGKRFRRIAGLAEVKDLRIHDLRHFATTALFMEGVPDTIIAKMTGHASRVVERYKHLTPSFKQQSVELIAGQLGKRLSRRISQGTKKGTTPKKAKPAASDGLNPLLIQDLVAEPTGLEPATSDVTGRRSNQLNYDSARRPDFQNRFASGRHGGIRTPNLHLVRVAVYR